MGVVRDPHCRYIYFFLLFTDSSVYYNHFSKKNISIVANKYKMIQIYTEKNENENNTFKLNNIVKLNGGMHDHFDTDKHELYIIIFV